MENGSTAGVVVWENLWAAPFASATRRAGGQLIASGRLPIHAMAASLSRQRRRELKDRTCHSDPYAPPAEASLLPPSPGADDG